MLKGGHVVQLPYAAQVATVYPELTSRKVIVTEWVEGEKLNHSKAEDIRALCSTLLNCYLIQLLETGLLHADPVGRQQHHRPPPTATRATSCCPCPTALLLPLSSSARKVHPLSRAVPSACVPHIAVCQSICKRPQVPFTAPHLPAPSLRRAAPRQPAAHRGRQDRDP